MLLIKQNIRDYKILVTVPYITLKAFNHLEIYEGKQHFRRLETGKQFMI